MANESALIQPATRVGTKKARNWTRILRNTGLASAVLACALTVSTGDAPARDDRYFAIGYSVALNGIPLGKGSFSGRVAGEAYRLKGDARLTGIAGALFNYRASGEVEGRLGNAAHSPRSFGSSASDDRATQTVAMRFSGRRVNKLSVNPPVRASKDRIEVTSGHMRNVVDPMSAMIVMATRPGRVTRDDCKHRIPVFNGRERFDLELRYKGMHTFNGNRRTSYSGPVVVCQALYKPIAGHRKNREEVDYYVRQRNMEVWLAPAGNTGLLVPVRMILPTPIGTGTINATAFVAS